MYIKEIFKSEPGNPQALPLFSSEIAAGFPSPADDYIDKSLDLNELVAAHAPSTFFVRVSGVSMEGAGIHSGDILVVDRSLQAISGRIIVAFLNGEFTVKRLIVKDKHHFLSPEHPNYKTIEITPDCDFEVWGVVTFVIHPTT